MTIAVGVACPEGLVLAADSRSSYGSPTGLRIATDNAHKVFELDSERRLAAATFGWALLSGTTIAGHMQEFSATQPPGVNVDEAANALLQTFGQHITDHVAAGYDAAPPAGVDVLGFLVAGYDDQGVGHIKQVGLPASGVIDRFATNHCGAVWQGQIDVMTRLVAGWDATRLDPQAWGQVERTALDGLLFHVPTQRFALQDAIDFASFVVRTTVDMQRFSNGTLQAPGGAPGCGGPIEIVAATRRAGLEWVQRTALRAPSPSRGEGYLD